MAPDTTSIIGTPSAIIEAYARAHKRAAAAGLVAYKTSATDMFEVPPTSVTGMLHRVSVVGRRWYDLRCDCKAAHQVACVHRAVVVHGRKYHCWAVRPTQALAAVAPSTPDEIASTEAIKAEIRAELSGWGVGPAHITTTLNIAEMNAAARAHHGMSAGQGTRIERAGDPLAACWE